MADPHHERVQQVFTQASALPPAERGAFLDQACEGDAELRKEVESLLAHGEQAGSDFMAPLSAMSGVDEATLDAGSAQKPSLNPFAIRDNLVGQTLGAYHLLGIVGTGGMGTVYEAQQTKPVRRRVALKLVKLGMDTREVVARFEGERQALALMNHPNVAAVYDAGATEQGRPYFVMEYVPGEPITVYCDKHRLSLPDRLNLFMQVCHAVQHAHQKGLIHRDIKPSNVLVMLQDGKPVPKVIDFGVAKATNQRLAEHTVFTEIGQLIGTPEYMSPEQAEMSQLDIDTRTDIYSLGVLLYELLTSALPFDSKTLRARGYAEIQRIIREVEPPKPSTRLSGLTPSPASEPRPSGSGSAPSPSEGEGRGEGVPLSTPPSTIDDVASRRQTDARTLIKRLRGDLDWIVMKCLEKDRTRRYDTASGLALEIQRYLTNEPVTAGAPTMGYRVRKFVRRNRAAVIAVSAVVVSLLAGLGGTIWQAKRATNEATRIEYNSYVANLEMAAAAMDFRQFDRVRKRLDACSSHLRGWEWTWLETKADSCLVKLNGYKSDVWSACFSPDGARIVTASSDQTAWVWDLSSGARLVELNGHLDRVRSASFSPDGTRIVTASFDQTARVWDTATGVNLAELKGHTGGVWSACFSPDGTRIATASADGTARVWDAATGRSLAELKGHTRHLYAACFSADATRIVTASTDKTARVWDAVTGTSLVELKGHSESVLSACFSSDGARIVTASWDKTARVWDAAAGAQLIQLTGHTGSVNSASFSPDGARIVTACDDNIARVWDAATGVRLIELKGHTAIIVSATFSPNGTQIVTASTDKTARLWDAGKGVSLAEYKGHTASVISACFSPDGTRIVTASQDGTGRVWDAGTGASLAELLNGHSSNVSSATFSPDGARIVTASQDQTARLWDTATGASLAEFKGHRTWVWFAAFNPDGKRIITASGDKTARVWDTSTGTSLAELKGHMASVRSACFSPDGARIVTASLDHTARVWDAATGVTLFELKGHTDRVDSAYFNSDSTRIVTASWDKTARVWDAATGKSQAELKGHTSIVLSACFSPNGDRIVTASGDPDPTARVWDAVTGARLAELKGHTSSVLSACFSPDGTRIVTASQDGTARVWDAATAASVAELKGRDSTGRQTGIVHFASFSPDGTRIVTATQGQTAIIWDGIPYRIRYAERERRERGEKDVNLGVQYMKEVRGEAPATWLSDPTSDIGRPDFSPITTRRAGAN